jgi:hypothetical protein
MKEETMTHLASEIFAKILREKNVRTFIGDPVELHRLFYELFISNPEIMDCFEFVKRANPYSPTLDNTIQWFQLTGVLSRKNPDFTDYSVDLDIVNQIIKNNKTHIEIKNIDLIDTIIPSPIVGKE